MEAWSISTAVREPGRIPALLQAIKPYEGQVWDKETQALFFCQIISLKLYRPEDMSDEHKNYLMTLIKK